MNSSDHYVSWSAFRSQFVAQDDGQLVGLTVKADRFKSWWDGKYDPKTWMGSLCVVRIMAPESHDWMFTYHGLCWTHVLNKFMSSVSRLSKKEIIMCAYYPITLTGIKFFNWPMTDGCFLARPLRRWEYWSSRYHPQIWFQQIFETERCFVLPANYPDTFERIINVSHTTYRLRFVIADMLFIESTHELDLSFDIHLRLLHLQGETGDQISCNQEQLSTETAILLESSKTDKFLYAVFWRSDHGKYQTRRDIKLYLRKLFKWFDTRRSDQLTSKPCPGIVLSEPDVVCYVSIDYRELPCDARLRPFCLGISD